MKKQLILTLLMWLAIVYSHAANIVAAEYFWDNDPGIGMGTTISISPQSDSVNVNFVASTSGLISGNHVLYIRTKDSNGEWSLSEGRSVNISLAISSAEYFWDTDPGVGLATPIAPFSLSDSVNLNPSISTSGLVSGSHVVYVRSKDTNGHWSLSEGRAVTISSAILIAEYFWDTDPGVGLATPIAPFSSPDSVNLNANISTTGLTSGSHVVYIRSKDNNGHWSLSEGRAVNISSAVVIAEYFWDTDPGVGLATQIAPFSLSDSVNLNPSISTSGLVSGSHAVYVRSKDTNGHWGLSEGRTVNISSAIVIAEYFWDTDPGIGLATPIAPFSSSDSVNLNPSISTLGLTSGSHVVYVRSKDTNGHWSLSEGRAVNIIPYLARGESFWDTDPGIGNGSTVFVTSGNTGPDSANFSINVSTAGLSYGKHLYYMRTMDNFGHWSLAEGRATEITMGIVAAECFIDTDPGVGNGTSFAAFAPSDSVNLNQQVPLTGYAPGLHYLYVRAKNNFGTWNVIESRPFNIQPASAGNADSIIAAEAFFDSDPGVGLGTAIPGIAAGITISGTLSIPTSGQQPGLHHAFVRFENNKNVWTVIDGGVFYIKPPEDPVTVITKLEYFFDSDPGVGSATNLDISGLPPNDTVILNANQLVPCLSNGQHYMYLRAKNNLNVWNVIDYDTLNVTTITALPVTPAGPIIICSPSAVSLHVDSASGISYQWLNNGVLINGQSFATIIATDSGNYSLQQSCASDVAISNAVEVTVANPPIPTTSSNSPVCVGNTLNLSSGGGINYSWMGPDGFTSTQQYTDVTNSVVVNAGTYTVTVSDANGCTAAATVLVTINNCPVLNLALFLEGFYTGNNTMISTLYNLGISSDPTATDSIQINLWQPDHLSNSVPDYSAKTILHTNAAATYAFPLVAGDNSFYIAIKHRNSMETWSASPVPFSTTTSYDFTSALTQAYGNGINPPMQNMGNGVYAFFGGDDTQDGNIDVADMAAVDNDASQFLFGYNATDCNGNGATDAADMALIDNNTQLMLFYARPY